MVFVQVRRNFGGKEVQSDLLALSSHSEDGGCIVLQNFRIYNVAKPQNPK
jgi:hypothetical protein